MKLLITGATGTVGGYLAEQVTGHGHQVTALVRDTSRATDKLPAEVEIIEGGDLTNAQDAPPGTAGGGSGVSEHGR